MSLRIPTIPIRIGETATGGKINRINETLPGGTGQSPIPPQTVGVGAAPGQLGMAFELETADALFYSDTTLGTLFAGVYQYVRLDPACPVSAARGDAAFIANPANAGNFLVTADSTVAANLNFVCGVFLGPLTPGNYGVIQILGLASLQFVTNVTNNANAQPVKIVNQAGHGYGEQLNTDFSAPTVATMTPYLSAGMIAAELPVDSTITRVWLRPNAYLV